MGTDDFCPGRRWHELLVGRGGMGGSDGVGGDVVLTALTVNLGSILGKVLQEGHLCTWLGEQAAATEATQCWL